MTDIAYVRKEMIAEQNPPLAETGMIKWARENLFSSFFNSVLTILALYFLFTVLREALPWMFNSSWTAGSLRECREVITASFNTGGNEGACWAVIQERFLQLMYGFYPSEFYWRPNLAFVLLLIALAPVLFAKVPRKMLWFSAAYPFFMPWLMWGGNVWVPILILAGIVLAFLLYSGLARVIGSLTAMIVGALFVILWLLFAVSAINQSLNVMFANRNIDSVHAELIVQSEVLTTDIAELETVMEVLQVSLSDGEERLEHLLTLAQNPWALKSEKQDYVDLITTTVYPLRSQVAGMSGVLSRSKLRLTANKSFVSSIDELPGQLAELPGLREQAASLRDALPASVSNVYTLESVENDVSAEDRNLLRKAVDAENDILTEESSISQTQAKIGLVGLTPVESAKFGGFMLSVIIGVTGIALSLPIGILLALGRQSDLMIVKFICVGFIEAMRGVPLITLLFVASTLLNYFLPPGTNFDLILRVVIMVTLFASAYMAEVIRGGLAALPTGQYEAADALGLDYWKATRLITMPQALKISIPGIVSTFIGLFKDTTLVSIIGILDPIGLTNTIRADANWNGIVWELYGFIAFMFFIFCFAMSRYSMYLERKLATGH